MSLLGVAFGLSLLVRGMAGQRRAARIGDTSSSTISAIAVGEVRVSGVVQVYRYNTRIGQVPAVFIAAIFRWRARQFFAAESDDRTRPHVSLGTA